jgi:hypothetical protein
MKLPKNWKTTLAGIALLLNAFAGAANNKDGWIAAISNTETLATISAGIGLIAAKDHNATVHPAP